MTTTTTKVQPLRDLSKARDGSYYTIAGCGGDLNEWVEGYEAELDKAGVGTPTVWYSVKGYQVNEFAGTLSGPDSFQPELTLLMFPLDGLDVGRLAMFKLAWQDRWFDDVVANMRPAAYDGDSDEEE